MKLEGEYRYGVSQERLWQALLDPEVLAGTLPGCEDLERVGENEYKGKLKMKVGPVQGLFEGTVQLTNLDPPNGYELSIQGNGAPGFMKGSGTLRLTPDGDGTVLSYALDAQVGGRIASVGQRLVESSAKVITRQGLQGLERQLAAPAPAEAGVVDAVPEGLDPDEVPTRKLVPDGATGADPAPQKPAVPSQSELAGEFVKGLAGELIPKQQRPILLVALVLITAIVIAVAMRTCGGG
ncbi:MAG TPA: carbon monoxide dehydrogenase subunit G [Thermoanaerobaculia bacterium]|nr:carbon monoxide dehydrogenase subunit G [Thermoanaerobaculia bacterium]